MFPLSLYSSGAFQEAVGTAAAANSSCSTLGDLGFLPFFCHYFSLEAETNTQNFPHTLQ